MVNNMHDDIAFADVTVDLASHLGSGPISRSSCRGDWVPRPQDQRRFAHHVSTARLPTEVGEFTCHAYRDHRGIEHLALVFGSVEGNDPVLVRVHSECLTGDIFGSRRCDCGQQLQTAMEAIVEAGAGVVVYLRGHEGRGIGVAAKIAAYALQDAGRDTVEANIELGLPVDSRDHTVGALILADLGIARVQLMSNNPAKFADLESCGLEVTERVAMRPAPNPDNIGYLRTKQQRMGHLLSGLDRPC